MCRLCERNSNKTCPVMCEKEKSVTLAKKLIFSSAEFPEETEMYININGEIQYTNDDETVTIGGELGWAKRKIKSNMSFAFTLTVTNSFDKDIIITSLVDPLLTVTKSSCNSCCNFILFCKPAYSVSGECLNRCYTKHGELINDTIKICPGKVGIFTIRGCANSRKLNIANFAVLKYKFCGSDREYVVNSDVETLAMENELTCCDHSPHNP